MPADPRTATPDTKASYLLDALTALEGGQPGTVTQTETREVRYSHLDCLAVN